MVDKIKKLFDKAESSQKLGNEQEAQAFFTAANKLLLTYNISKEALDLAQSDNKMTTKKVKYGRHTNKAYYGNWEIQIAQSLAYANFCEVLRNTSSGQIYFIGSKSNVMAITYLFDQAKNLLKMFAKASYESKKKKPANRRGYIRAFLRGAAVGLGDKIVDEANASMQANVKTTAIVEDRRAAVKEYMHKKFDVKTGNAQRVKVGDAEAFAAGDAEAFAAGHAKGKRTSLKKGAGAGVGSKTKALK